MATWLNTLLVATCAAFLTACGGSDDPIAVAPGNLVEVASANGFDTLVSAADKAGLADALSNPDASLTVFAPTDAAFTSLGQSLGFADGAAMVAALDTTTIAKILTYHVLPTRQDAAAIAIATASAPPATLYEFPAGTATTLAIDASAGVKITDAALNEAMVTTADVAASNGVIHVIDRVLVPPGVLNVVQMAQTNAGFSVLVEAVVAAKLAPTLSGAGPFTVFAPTNDAFVAALAELGTTKDALLSDPALASILTYHVVVGDIRAADVVALPKPATVTTVQGASFSVDAALDLTDGRSRVAHLVATDVIASNGVIHVIDKVLLPPL